MPRHIALPRVARVAGLLSAAVLLTLAACRDGTSPTGLIAPPGPGTPAASASRLDSSFTLAAREFGVPADLLRAISYTETRFQMVDGQQEFEGMAPAKGVMALRGDHLTRGAALAHVTVAEASTDERANVRAAAALLADWARTTSFDRADIGAWAPLVARYSGIASTDGQASYVHQEVYRALASGIRSDSRTGISVPSTPTRVRFTQPSAPSFSQDYAAAVWRPSPNYGSRPAGTDISMLVIHDCEGSYTSCWSWLTNSQAQASAHYVVNESGSEISQLVLEANRAWHVSATYDCSLNSNVDCALNGVSVNHFSVGIEHGGYASQTTWPVGQIDASAKLACDITQGQGIARDRYHIIAHGQLQPATRTDPGPNWPWTDYLNRINGYCNTSIIIDSNNGNNNTAVGYVDAVSANWASSSATPGYYGSGYWYANTAAVSDPVTFWFYLAAPATRTIDAWWTAGTNRSTTTPFVITNASGTKLATVSVNQTLNGGKWNALGTWSFPAGWNKVQVSRWTTAGSVVIADAVRVR